MDEKFRKMLKARMRNNLKEMGAIVDEMKKNPENVSKLLEQYKQKEEELGWLMGEYDREMMKIVLAYLQVRREVDTIVGVKPLIEAATFIGYTAKLLDKLFRKE